jgi:MFS family permease
MPVLVISHFLFGIIYASSSIAITTETIALIPRENQALASSVLTTMMWLGTGCSSLLSSFILKLDCLKPFWPLGDMVMSNYDAIIILSGVMIFILTSALGLVPSIIRKKPA